MRWNRDKILQRIKQLYKQNKDLSYNAMCRREQSLVSASAYHFGSYRRAVEQAGIDYADVLRRPRWTRQHIIQLIKAARRKGEELHWSAVTRRRDELGKAAFASLQPRLFGRWERALQAAGLDADEVARYRKWDRNSIVFELRERARSGEALNSGALQAEEPGLHAAAVRHFGSYDVALRAARVDPNSVRRRRAWKKEDVIKALKQVARKGQHISDSAMRKESPALYGAAVRLFGSFTRAREAAGIRFKRGGQAVKTQPAKATPAKTRSTKARSTKERSTKARAASTTRTRSTATRSTAKTKAGVTTKTRKTQARSASAAKRTQPAAKRTQPAAKRTQTAAKRTRATRSTAGRTRKTAR